VSSVRVTRLQWSDQRLGTIPFPARPLELLSGFGSGLTRRRGDPEDVVWAVGDRGPNIKIRTAAREYGWTALAPSKANADAKLMPRPDLGPAIAQLRVSETKVELLAAIRLTDRQGKFIPGTPVPEGVHAECEPTVDLQGRAIDPDPAGMDTEGIAALSDGSFWLGDEYGPSLVQVDASGRVLRRLIPEGVDLDGAAIEAQPRLPALAARRHVNRGFEAIAVPPSERHLYLAFQSPLAHPDRDAHRSARHVRIWRLDPDGRVTAQFLYPLDPPETFERDAKSGSIDWSDLKLCELAAVGEDQLLVLERSVETSKIYRIDLEEGLLLPPEHLEIGTRPTLEQLSAAGELGSLPVLDKELLFTSDEHCEVTADMEGMALLSETSLLLVSDNDFGVEGKTTAFFRLDFAHGLATR
jgi:hypothetical protein